MAAQFYGPVVGCFLFFENYAGGQGRVGVSQPSWSGRISGLICVQARSRQNCTRPKKKTVQKWCRNGAVLARRGGGTRAHGSDYITPAQRAPNGESSMWGDYHARELALLLLREARGESYLTFFDYPAAPVRNSS